MLLPGVCRISVAPHATHSHTHTYRYCNPGTRCDEHAISGGTGHPRFTENSPGNTYTMVPTDAHADSDTFEYAHRHAAANRHANVNADANRHTLPNRNQHPHRDGHAHTHRNADGTACRDHTERHANLDAYLDAYVNPHSHLYP